MAGSADWVIDADTHNLGPDSNGKMTVGQGSDSNPAINPTPAQSNITSSTPETYWTGALSSWGIDAVKRGFAVQTLPYNGAITYGNSSNAQDLSNYKVYVVDEPNILFTVTEKTAILNFVRNGGGLMVIADHSGSDRNNDGSDSVAVWNDLFTTNGSGSSNPFGIKITTGSNVNVSTASVDTTSTDPIAHGPVGNVQNLEFNNGSTLTIDTSANSTAKAAIWQTSSHTNTNALAAYASYGSGRVVVVGDSSPADDGTGDPNDSLFHGWDSPTSTNALVFQNATLWLSGSTTTQAPIPEPASLAMLGIGGVLLLRRSGRRGRRQADHCLASNSAQRAKSRSTSAWALPRTS